MRLLNAETLVLEDFPENAVPRYAILSHTWSEEEVTYQDITHRRSAATKKKGFKKLQLCCREALREQLSYAWIDTCCIDKSSSAELSEAINSMFYWYRSAAVCYAFLEDVESGPEEISETVPDPEQVAWLAKPKIRWFSRGWTLQELLASTKIIFFGKKWAKLGDKDDLADALSDITGISPEYLYGEPLSSASVAERMSWASQRETTREEDRAYSLMGVFDVNMPLLYGEGGKKAFLRLQEEIMKVTGDQSIFAWGLHQDTSTYGQPLNVPYSIRPLHMDRWGLGYVGLLASSPSQFYGSGMIETQYWNTSTPHILGSRGIEANIPISEGRGILACGLKWRPRVNIALPLRRIHGIWYRRQEEAPTTHQSFIGRLWWAAWGTPRITLATKPWLFAEERRYPWLLGNIPGGMHIAEVVPKRSFSVQRNLVFTSSRLSASVHTPPSPTGPSSRVKILRWVRIACGAEGKDLLLCLTLQSCRPPHEETALFDYWITVIPSNITIVPFHHLSGGKTIINPADGRTLRLLARSRWINNKRLLVVDLQSGALSWPRYMLCELEHTIRALIFRRGFQHSTFVQLYRKIVLMVSILYFASLFIAIGNTVHGPNLRQNLRHFMLREPTHPHLMPESGLNRALLFVFLIGVVAFPCVELVARQLDVPGRYVYFTRPDLLRHQPDLVS